MCKVLRPADTRGVFGIRYLQDAVCAFLENETGLTVQTIYQKNPYTVVVAEFRQCKGADLYCEAGVANKIPRDKWDPDNGLDLATTRAVRDIADHIIAAHVADPEMWPAFVFIHVKNDNIAHALIAWRAMAAAIQAHNEACNGPQESE